MLQKKIPIHNIPRS